MIIKNTKKNNERGFLVLTMVLIVCAVVLIIGTFIFLRSISETNQSADSEKSLKALNVVNACGEYALGQLALTPERSYTGDYTLSVGDETCYIYPITGTTVKTIQASSTVSSFTKKILIQVDISTARLLINSWNEVADF
jgi:H+/gluconate symporter-like permease